PAVAAGTMDVRDLGAALDALGRLIEQANRVLNADRATVVVSVHARFERGSFDVLLEVLQTLAAQGALEQVKDVTYLLTILGFADTGEVGRVGTSVLKFLKWLRDKAIAQKQANPQTGTVTITTGDNARIEVNQTTLTIAEDPQARQALNGVLEPLRWSGLSGDGEVRELPSPCRSSGPRVRQGRCAAGKAPRGKDDDAHRTTHRANRGPGSGGT